MFFNHNTDLICWFVFVNLTRDSWDEPCNPPPSQTVRIDLWGPTATCFHGFLPHTPPCAPPEDQTHHQTHTHTHRPIRCQTIIRTPTMAFCCRRLRASSCRRFSSFCLRLRIITTDLDSQSTTEESHYVSIQRCEVNLCAKLEYRIKHLRIKHPTSQREQNRHFLINCH